MIIADEETGGVGVVEGIPDDMVESRCHIDTTIWHQVVNVIDDEECRFDSFYCLLDGGQNTIEIILEVSEFAKAKQ